MVLQTSVQLQPVVVAHPLQGVLPGLQDDQILLGRWAADDLRAGPGDAITLTYFVMGEARKLEEGREAPPASVQNKTS